MKGSKVVNHQIIRISHVSVYVKLANQRQVHSGTMTDDLYKFLYGEEANP